MSQALDYSSGPPAGAAVRQAGYAAVIRYAGTPGRPKNITRTEFEDLSMSGVDVALVYENNTGDALLGYSEGQLAAENIANDAVRIGFPANRPLYFTVDRSVTSPSDFALVMLYLDGAASVIGRERVGVYGEYEVVKYALEGGHARYGWQTVAWSGGQQYAGAHLFQRLGTVLVDGIACDVNDILAPDWGQHSYTPNPGAPTEDDMPDRQLQPTTGRDACVTLVVPKNATELVVSLGWVPMEVKKLAFFGPTPAQGVNQIAVAWDAPNPFRIDPARCWEVPIPTGAVTAELTYSMAADPGRDTTGVVGFR